MRGGCESLQHGQLAGVGGGVSVGLEDVAGRFDRGSREEQVKGGSWSRLEATKVVINVGRIKRRDRQGQRCSRCRRR